MIGPKVMERLGHAKTLGIFVVLAMPFMLIIANGDKFGKYTVLITGIALFFRSGLANLAEPVESSLPMEMVEEDEGGNT